MAGGREYSKTQHKIIDRYYANRDSIALSKLGELVTELYLAEGEAAKKRLWARAEKALANLVKENALSAQAVERVVGARDVEGLAALVKKASG